MVNVVCPSCKAHVAVPLTDKNNRKSVVCGKCKKDFLCELVRIRAKRSRGLNGITSHRDFDVRVVGAGGVERLIQFRNAEYGDFELRAKDQVVFIYQRGELRGVQNLTIGLFYNVQKPNEELAWIVAIVVVTAALILWGVVSVSHR